jgi:hypothetical protein
MSIRFYLDRDYEKLQEQLQWCRNNIPSSEYRATRYHTFVDFVNEEDAMLFSLKFGMRKHSTLIERMIARESMYERMENLKTRDNQAGLGPFSL